MHKKNNGRHKDLQFYSIYVFISWVLITEAIVSKQMAG